MLRKRLILALAVYGILSLKFPIDVMPYQVSCNDNSFRATSITSVFGEARSDFNCGVGTACNPTRFHNGIDIADIDCSAPNTVESIEDGDIVSVSTVTPSVTIRSTSGHEFIYVHVVPTVTLGHVNIGESVGNI